MKIRILGSAAGGGLPQWNCHCANCTGVREGRAGLKARTQSSIAVTGDGRHWVLFNASPDLRAQINAAPELSAKPNGSSRGSPIKAVVMTNGDVDHVSGLLNLREMQGFSVYGTLRVLGIVAGNSMFNVLNHDLVPRSEIRLGAPVALKGDGVDLGLTVEAFAVPGKIALYLEDETSANFGSQPEDTVAVKITETATGRHFFYVPGCARVDDALAARVAGAPLVLFDGTLYTDDEMIRQGLMPKTGNRMGHISISGPDGSIAAFAPLNVARKVYVHINNSNPVLDELSPERRATEAAGWEVGYDGMEITL